MTDADLRAYLLGQTTDAIAEQVELRALDDEEFFVTVQSVEDDLFDDYVRNRMSGDERPLFLAKYGDATNRLRVAHALASRTARPRVVSRPTTSAYWKMAAAAVLVAGIGFTLASRSRSSQERATPSVATSAPAREAPPPVALLLTLGSSRSATPPVGRALGSDAVILQLRVRMDPADVFDSYSMELRSDRGTVVWRSDTLHASAANGDLTLVGDVPAPSLSSATYELTVLGSTAGRAPEALGFAAVKIAR